MRLLVAIDFSETTRRVLECAQKLAPALKAEVVLFHTVTPATPLIDTETEARATEKPLSERFGIAKTAEEKLHVFAETLRNRGIRVSEHLSYSDEVEAIINNAESLAADMIILGSHGHGALYHLLIGSVSEGVIRKATCPVVIVPAQG